MKMDDSMIDLVVQAWFTGTLPIPDDQLPDTLEEGVQWMRRWRHAYGERVRNHDPRLSKLSDDAIYDAVWGSFDDDMESEATARLLSGNEAN
jgi:hypothetical protein